MRTFHYLCAVLAVALVPVAIVLLQQGLALHMSGHVVLLDLVGILGVFAIPAARRHALVRRIDAVADGDGLLSAPANGLRSPIVLLAVWTIVV